MCTNVYKYGIFMNPYKTYWMCINVYDRPNSKNFNFYNDICIARGESRIFVWGGGYHFMASAEARAYMGVWGLCSQWGPGAKPLL